jgi:hypothetical protein
LRLPGWSRPPKVYVDAKILNVHDPSLKREAFVGFLVEETGERDVREVEAAESDDAEVLAILFAIERLKDRLKLFTVVCDHESVVSEANRDIAKNPSSMMKVLREAIHESEGRIKVVALQSNPAHGVVTEYVNRVKGSQAPSG